MLYGTSLAQFSPFNYQAGLQQANARRNSGTSSHPSVGYSTANNGLSPLEYQNRRNETRLHRTGVSERYTKNYELNVLA